MLFTCSSESTSSLESKVKPGLPSTDTTLIFSECSLKWTLLKFKPWTLTSKVCRNVSLLMGDQGREYNMRHAVIRAFEV